MSRQFLNGRVSGLQQQSQRLPSTDPDKRGGRRVRLVTQFEVAGSKVCYQGAAALKLAEGDEVSLVGRQRGEQIRLQRYVNESTGVRGGDSPLLGIVVATLFLLVSWVLWQRGVTLPLLALPPAISLLVALSAWQFWRAEQALQDYRRQHSGR